MKKILYLMLPLLLHAEGIFFEESSRIQETFRELEFENETVRVWKTTIYPNSPLKMHRHEKPRLIIALNGGTLKKITERGEITYLRFDTGRPVWMDADPPGELHADVNESDAPIVVLVVEMKVEYPDI